MNGELNLDKVPEVVEVEHFIERLAMLMPVYREGGGDMTRVVLEDGEMWDDPRPVSIVLRAIARYFAVDLVAVRERYGDILGKRLYVPLPLSPHLVLMPLKMRTPRVQKDGTTGYVATHLLERVLEGGNTTSCHLHVRGAGQIECLQSRDFARTQIRHARIVQTFYEKTMSLPFKI